MNKEKEIKIAEHVKEILTLIGEDSGRTGLLETPMRVARMYSEVFKGYEANNYPTVTTFPNGQDGLEYDQMIIDEGTFHSHCEHHMVSFSGKYWFAYIPSEEGHILGLSKVARIIDYFAARLQVQERLTLQIVDSLWNTLKDKSGGHEPIGMALVMKGEHLCKKMRGVKKDGKMTSIELRGALRDNPETRAEFLKFVNGGN